MSKGLEALRKINIITLQRTRGRALEVVEVNVAKYHKKEIDIIEKELEALEIIKKHNYVNGLKYTLKKTKNYDEFINYYSIDFFTKEEYDLLKEVLL